MIIMEDSMNKCFFVAAFLSIYDIKAINALGFTHWNSALKNIAKNLGDFKDTYIKNLRDEFDAISGNHRVGWVNRPTRKSIKEVYIRVKDLPFNEYLEDVKSLLYNDDLNCISEAEGTEPIILNESLILNEGQKKLILSTTYERNLKARKICLDYYGPICQICGFDAEKIYGLKFKGKIQVHHKVPLNEIGKNYRVDPIKDLVPVCPNCHMIIHSKKNGYYTINEISKKVKESNSVLKNYKKEI